MLLAVGTFTDGFGGGAPARGLYLFEFDAARGTVRHLDTVEGMFSPSYLAAHPQLPVIFAAERHWSETDRSQGALTTLRLDRTNGRLVRMDRRPSGGAFTAHVRVSPSGDLVAVANPRGPTVALFPTGDDGVPSDAQTIFHFSGEGARERQSAPWPHGCWFNPTGTRMLVCDLGLDRISLYDVDEGARDVVPSRRVFAQVNSGAGPRHLAIRPDSRFAYVANELDGTISVFMIDETRGSLVIVQTLSCAPTGFTAPCPPAEIICSSDGKQLYVTVRGADMVAHYGIDDDSGRIDLVGHVPTLGNAPRHIALSSDGTLAFVSNQLSGEIIVFAIDDGRLTPAGIRIAVPSPTCVLTL